MSTSISFHKQQAKKQRLIDEENVFMTSLMLEVMNLPYMDSVHPRVAFDFHQQYFCEVGYIETSYQSKHMVAKIDSTTNGSVGVAVAAENVAMITTKSAFKTFLNQLEPYKDYIKIYLNVTLNRYRICLTGRGLIKVCEAFLDTTNYVEINKLLQLATKLVYWFEVIK